MSKTQRKYPLGFAANITEITRATRTTHTAALRTIKSNIKECTQNLAYITTAETLEELAAAGGTTVPTIVPMVAKIAKTVQNALNIYHAERKDKVMRLVAARTKLAAAIKAPSITSTDFIGVMKELGEYVPGSIRHSPHNNVMFCDMKSLHISRTTWLQDVRVKVNTRDRRISIQPMDTSVHNNGETNGLARSTSIPFTKWVTEDIIRAIRTNGTDEYARQILKKTCTGPGIHCRVWALCIDNNYFSLNIGIQENVIGDDGVYSPCTPIQIRFTHPSMISKYGSQNRDLTPEYYADLVPLLNASNNTDVSELVKKILTEILNRYTV